LNCFDAQARRWLRPATRALVEPYREATFFELAADDQESQERRDFTLPPWVDPPESEIGSIVPVELVVTRSANVVVVLPTIRAYRTGCMLTVDVVCRQGSLTAEDWWDLHNAMFRSLPSSFRGGRLPDRLLRLGVRYPDGTTATTLQRRPHLGRDAEPPPGPVLTYSPRGGGVHGRGDQSDHCAP
jgi:hypothetical protein